MGKEIRYAIYIVTIGDPALRLQVGRVADCDRVYANIGTQLEVHWQIKEENNQSVVKNIKDRKRNH
jgi:hypothetical protein